MKTLTTEAILESYRSKRVLVTGHTGFKGGWMSYWLGELGAEICGYSLDIPTDPAFFEVLGLRERIQHETEDIRDYGSLLKVVKTFKPEIVFHLAAQPIVRQALRDPRTTYETNIMGTVNILEAVREVGGVEAVVCITSDKCYENKEWDYGYRENDELGGSDPYSASKASAEHVIDAYYRSYFKETTLGLASGRAGNVIGGGDWAIDRIIPDCVRAWSTGECVQIRNREATRPWQHVLEPVYGYLSLGTYLMKATEGVSGESFNFGPSEVRNYTVGEVVEKMTETWEGTSWEGVSERPGNECNLLKLSADKAWRKLGWRTELDFNEMMQWVAEWYQGYYKGRNMENLTKEQLKAFEGKLCKKELLSK